nr:hypothetical protein [uncultured Anaerotignum sp.]
MKKCGLNSRSGKAMLFVGILVVCMAAVFFAFKYPLSSALRSLSKEKIASCMIQKHARSNDKIAEAETKWIYDEESLAEIQTLLSKLKFSYDSNVTNIYYKSEIYHIRLFDINNNECCLLEVVPEGNIYYNGRGYQLSKKYPRDYITSKLDRFVSE